MLFYPESFKVSTPTDREIEIERDFNAPRQLVFDAFTKPELVKRWLLGPDGWTMLAEEDIDVLFDPSSDAAFWSGTRTNGLREVVADRKRLAAGKA